MNSETQTRVTMSPLTPVKTFYEETENIVILVTVIIKLI